MLAYQRVIEIVFIPFVGSISRCIFITMGCWSGCSCDLCISLYIYVGSICGCIFNNQKWQFKPMKNGFKKTLVMKENQEDWGSIMKFAASFGEKKNSVTVLCRWPRLMGISPAPQSTPRWRDWRRHSWTTSPGLCPPLCTWSHHLEGWR